MKIYSFSLILFAFLACASKKDATTPPPDQLMTYLEITKTPCFGRCPTFTLTIKENGLAILDGKQNIEHIGLYHKVLDEDQMLSLKQICQEASLFALKDSYEQKIMDLPTTTIRYTFEGKTKVISGNKDFPKGFQNVVAFGMEIVKSKGWELKEAYNTK